MRTAIHFINDAKLPQMTGNKAVLINVHLYNRTSRPMQVRGYLWRDEVFMIDNVRSPNAHLCDHVFNYACVEVL